MPVIQSGKVFAPQAFEERVAITVDAANDLNATYLKDIKPVINLMNSPSVSAISRDALRLSMQVAHEKATQFLSTTNALLMEVDTQNFVDVSLGDIDSLASTYRNLTSLESEILGGLMNLEPRLGCEELGDDHT